MCLYTRVYKIKTGAQSESMSSQNISCCRKPFPYLFRGLGDEGVTVLHIGLGLGLSGKEGELTAVRVAGGIGDTAQSMRHMHTL